MVMSSCANTSVGGIAEVKLPVKRIANIVKAVNFCLKAIFEIIKRLYFQKKQSSIVLVSTLLKKIHFQNILDESYNTINCTHIHLPMPNNIVGGLRYLSLIFFVTLRLSYFSVTMIYDKNYFIKKYLNSLFPMMEIKSRYVLQLHSRQAQYSKQYP